MHDFVFKEISDANIETELSEIGFDSSYIHKASEKFEYKNIKIFGLSVAQANILKQTALTVGADCGTHRETITGRVDASDCILGGSVSQIKKISEKLKSQPFGLKVLGYQLADYVSDSAGVMSPKLVGILNVTPNSFSDGGMYNDFESAKAHLLELIEDGADIIDIGAESTKHFSEPVSPAVQLEKLLPLIDFAKEKTVISIDTRSARVAEECIKAGARIINDVSGFDFDEKMAETIAKYDVQVVIQHSAGSPDTMAQNHVKTNLADEIFLSLKQKIDNAVRAGIGQENIIVDPGIGFGKTQLQNIELIKRIRELQSLGCLIMLGTSRKSFLDMQDKDNNYKDIFTVAINALALERGVDYLRVHNVKLHRELINLMDKFNTLK